jgi:hypothetical protein
MPFTAKTAACQFSHADLLRLTGRGLPEALILIKAVEKAHKKPGTILFNYSVLLPYISGDTDPQVKRITFQEYAWLVWLHLIWTARC